VRLARSIAALSVASVGILGLAACSAGADAPGSVSTPTTGAEKAPAKESSSDLTAENFVQRITDAQLDAGSVRMTMTSAFEGETMDMTGDVVFTDGSQKLAMTMTVPEAGEVQLRVVDNLLYLHMGELSQNKFVQIDPNDASNPLAGEFQGITEDMDPTASVKGLEGAISSVEKVGDPVDVGGVQAQQYTVVVDTTKVSGSMKEDLDASGGAIPDTVTYQYWIDADDRMHKTTIDLAGIVTELTFSKWGEDLQVVAPAPEEILTEPLF
jgi:lipoprotein LprG